MNFLCSREVVVLRCICWWVPGLLLAAAAGAEPRDDASLAQPRLEVVSSLKVEFQFPPPDSVVPEPRACGAYIAGRAGLRHIDVVLVLDTSASAADPTGADIDGDGHVGRAWLDAKGQRQTSDPGDSVLAAEIAAARQLMQELDVYSTRVGIVAFAGSEPETLDWLWGREPSARLLQPLTRDHAAADRALVALQAHAPVGGTDMAAGIDRAVEGFGEPDDADTRRIVLFFTDGYPTLPHGREQEAQNVLAVFDAARRARDARVEVHTFAIGEEAVDWPLALLETSERTGGSFTPLRHPEDLIDSIRYSGVGEVRSVVLRNATTQHLAEPFRVAPDGAFQGFVDLVEGANEIEVNVVTRNGAEARRTLKLRVEPGAAPIPVPPALLHRKTVLLEACLDLARQRQSAAEASHAKEVRVKLTREIERERELARQRARDQRKLLQLEAEVP